MPNIDTFFWNTVLLPLSNFNMNILILGSGGREHALAWKFSQSDLCTRLFIAPGNAGTSDCGTNTDLDIMNFEQVGDFCKKENIDLVMVGPEDPLVSGVYDFFENNAALNEIHVIGPSAHGARLEGSKAFAKEFMLRHDIPTAAYREFTEDNFEAGVEYIRNHTSPIVLKADGLAAGKGVVIAEDHELALDTFTGMIRDKKFGASGTTVVIEEFLSGIECSVFVLTDGNNYLLLPSAKDYKRIGEGDKGLNTGGMGAISPVPFMDDIFMQKINDRVIVPTINGIRTEKIIYKGFVFIGLIMVNGDPFVIEYNCRLGDPETEVILPRIENDLLPLLLSLKNNNLHEHSCQHSVKHAATVMLVSKGYPENYGKGKVITGFEDVNEGIVFHAGTKKSNDAVVSNGGRVMAATALGASLQDALDIAKSNAGKINFDGKYFRKDIGWEFV